MNEFFDQNDLYAITHMFNSAYKAGVMDAEDVDDEGSYEEFYRDVSVPGVYGRLNDFVRLTIDQWRITLMQINMTRSKPVSNMLLNVDINKTFPCCMFPISIEFYLMGIRDYYANPTIHDFTLFDTRQLLKWTSKGIKGIGMDAMMMDIQVACLNRSIIDSKTKNKYSFQLRKYETFMRRLWLAINSEYTNFIYDTR